MLSFSRWIVAAGAVSLLAPFPACAQKKAKPTTPDFGSHVLVIGPDTDRAEAQKRIDAIYAEQAHSEFGAGRYALLLKPGKYQIDVPLGFYTQVSGLGASPDEVELAGDLRVTAASRNDNATTTFWRGAENFSVTPTRDGSTQWAVSQATYLRRMHLRGKLVLHQNRGWASGGWIADSAVDGTVDSGTQQQWISRNTEWDGWTGSNWNMVFVGVKHAPEGTYPRPPFTRIDATPVIREKPYLVYQHGEYQVMVPGVRRNSSGVSWKAGAADGLTRGRAVPLSRFYIAHPETDTASTLNAQLRRGMHLFFTPGIYDLDAALDVTRRDTLLYGLGFATLRPTHGTTDIHVGDADGVVIAGLLLDAGEQTSPSLLEVGTAAKPVRAADRNDPVTISDVFFRVGGAAPGNTEQNLVVRRDWTIIDHTWIWRADHGRGAGWTTNHSDTGLLVDANDVTSYGLFVEHHQKFQVLWNGERGRTFFYQSEIPYDVPDQATWKSAPATNGWASYKVGDTVRQHEAWGLGIYSVFRKPDVVLSRAVEVPDAPGVQVHHVITVALGNLGEITHIVNDAGEPTVIKPKRIDRTLDEYPVHKPE